MEMFKEYKTRVKKGKGEDCRVLSINSVLFNKGYDDFVSVWKQNSLYYLKEENSSYGFLYSKYMSFKEELGLAHNIQLNDFVSNSEVELIEYLNYLINCGEPIIIHVDTFSFSMNSNYGKQHLKHCIVIIGREGKKYIFIDDHYQTKGSIEQQDLIKAMDLSYFNTPKKYKFEWINIEKANMKICCEDYLSVVELNVSHSNTFQSNILNLSNSILGERAIDYAVRDYRDHIQKDDSNLNASFLYDLYLSFTRIANTRYLYSDFLKKLDGYYSVEDLIYSVETSAQTWKVASNMALKSIYAKKERQKYMFLRICERIGNLNIIESKIVHFSNRLLG
jgi:hypothetical protein